MRSVRDALADATAAALPVAVVYFAGWAYLSKYLAQFDIDATQVSIALTTVLVYAFIPLKSFGVVFYCLIVLSVVGYMMTTILSKTVKRLSFTFGLVGLVGLLLMIDDAASRAASNMAAFVWAGEKSISVPAIEMGKDSDEVKEFAACRTDDRLRQIIGLTDEMFVLCRDKYAPCNYGMLFAVSKAGRINYTAKRRRSKPLMWYVIKGCISTILLGCACSAVAFAQATQDADAVSWAEATKKVMAMDGPYTLAGSFSVYGYVVERKGKNVRFRPCTGNEIAVDENALVKSEKGCDQEAPGTGESFSVNCGLYEPAPSNKFDELVASAAAIQPGTLYSEDAMGNYDQIDATEPKAKSVYAQIESIKPCKGIVLGFGSSGLPVLQILEVNKQF